MKYYIIAGEASGDMYGALLMRALRETDPTAEFRFWGGDAMESVDGKAVRHIRDLAIMGFIEVALHLRTVLGNITFCKKDIDAFAPDAIIYIDYPGFNLKIEKWAHARGYRNFHYISPQLWAWKKGRVKQLRQNVDALYYILPFEQDFYADGKLPQAHFVGHPLLDVVKQKDNASNSPLKGFDSAKPIIALLPGSRKQELRKMLPDMVALAQRHPEYKFVVAGMHLIGKDFYETYLSKAENLAIVYNQTYELLSQAHAAVVCSGTATLETALFNVPQVVCYKANPISIAVARKFVGQRIRFISLVNLIADREVVKELIQEDLTTETIEAQFAHITSPEGRHQIQEGYNEVRKKLGNTGATTRTAKHIIETISTK